MDNIMFRSEHKRFETKNNKKVLKKVIKINKELITRIH